MLFRSVALMHELERNCEVIFREGRKLALTKELGPAAPSDSTRDILLATRETMQPLKQNFAPVLTASSSFQMWLALNL